MRTDAGRNTPATNKSGKVSLSTYSTGFRAASAIKASIQTGVPLKQTRILNSNSKPSVMIGNRNSMGSRNSNQRILTSDSRKSLGS